MIKRFEHIDGQLRAPSAQLTSRGCSYTKALVPLLRLRNNLIFNLEIKHESTMSYKSI